MDGEVEFITVMGCEYEEVCKEYREDFSNASVYTRVAEIMNRGGLK